MNLDATPVVGIKENILLKGYTPIKRKIIQDILPLWGFLVILGGISYLGVRAFQTGDIGRYIYNTDSWGNICGRKENNLYTGIPLSNKNMADAYFGLTITFKNSEQQQEQINICINRCPATKIDCYLLLNQTIYAFNDTFKNQVCDNKTISQHISFGNQCVHLSNFVVNSSNHHGFLIRGTANEVVQLVVQPLKHYWRDIIYLSLVTFFLIMAVVLLIQLFTRLLLILLIICGVLTSLVATAYLWYNYVVSIGAADENKIILSFNNALPFLNVTNALNSITFPELRNSSNLLVFSIAASLISLIVIITIAFMSESISLTIRLFDEACQTVYKRPVLLIQALETMLFVVVVLTYIVLVFALLFSSMEVPFNRNGLISFQFEVTWLNIGLLCAHVLGCLYLIEFIFACQQIILADSVSSWFFSERSFVFCPTCYSTGYLIAFNLGSAALGAMIILTLRLVKIIFCSLYTCFKRKKSSSNGIVANCLAICYRFLIQMSYSAYICVGMFGDSFCFGGKRAVSLISKNKVKMFSLYLVKQVCFYVIKLVIVCSVMLTSLIWFTASIKFNSAALQYAVPIAVVSATSFTISTFIFNTYDVAMDTIFLCFCFDKLANNGTTRPFYSSKKLQAYMLKRRRQHEPPKCNSFTSINWEILTGEPNPK